MWKRPLILAVSAVAGMACIPSQDNPADPHNRPSVLLSVVDLNPGSLACPASTPPPPYSSVIVSPRGHCLALFASGNDPRNAYPITYTFTLPDQAPVQVSGSETALFLLSPGFQRLQVPNTQVPFSVIARNAEGDTSLPATSFVQLTNQAPTVIGDAFRILPVGGYPWDPQASLKVPFDAQRSPSQASSNPNGDPMTYCWTFPGPVLTCGTAATVSFAVPTVEGGFVAGLQITDVAGVASTAGELSARASVPIEVGDRPLWLMSGSPGSPAIRLDTGVPVSAPFHTAFANASLLIEPGEASGFVAVQVLDTALGSIPTLSLLTWPDAQVPAGSPNAVPIETPAGIAADSPHGRVWSMAGGPGDVQELTSWTVGSSGALTLAQGPYDLDLPVTFSVNYSYQLQLDPAGTVWVGTIGLSSAFTVAFSGTGSPPVQPVLPLDGPVIAMSSRPFTSELWMAVSVPGGTEIQIFEQGPAGPVLKGSFSLGSNYLTSLAFATEDDLWVVVANQAIELVDASVLETAGPLHPGLALQQAEVFAVQSTITAADPLQFGLVTLAVDPVQGTLFASAGGDPITEVRLDGVTFAGQPDRLEFVEVTGAVWTGPVPLERVPQIGRTDSALAVTNGGSVGVLGDVDWTTGWVWFVTGSPNGILAAADDGSTVLWDTIQVPAGNAGLPPVPVPALTSVRLEPGGTQAWAFVTSTTGATAYGGVIRYDLSQQPPVALPVLGLSSSSRFAPTLFVPSAPVPGSTPFVWAIEDPSTAPAVGRLTEDGTTFTRDLVIPENESAEPNRMLIARSLRTNTLCVTTIDTAGILRVRNVSPSGVVTLLAANSVGSAPVPRLGGVGESEDGLGGDLCWVAVGAAPGTFEVDAFNSAGTQVADLSLAVFSVFSIDARSPDLVFLTAAVGVPPGPGQLFGTVQPMVLRLDVPSGTFTQALTPSELQPGASNPFLIGPESAAEAAP